MNNIIKDLNELTPIEEYNGVYYKRDDLFQPFDDIPLSGGKVRQAMQLLINNKDKIKNEFNNTVIVGTSVNSPQGIIVSRVAKELGMNCIIVYGNTNKENLMKNNLTHNTSIYTKRLDTESKLAYEPVLSSRVFEICENEKKDYFFVKFGLNMEDNTDAIIDTVANQCENIPDDIEYIIVPVGSAIMMGGIIKGCRKFNKKAKVIGIQTAGYNRLKTIYKILNLDLTYNFDFIIDNTYPYSKHLDIEVIPGFKLDPVYEAKAYDYMVKHYDNLIKEHKTLFWVVGDSNMVRNNYYGKDEQ